MIEIRKGPDTLLVSRGAYEEQFKPLGFRPVRRSRPKTDAPLDEAELLEKPISQWSKQELKAYADANGIDLSGLRSVTQVREAVKAAIGAQTPTESL